MGPDPRAAARARWVPALLDTPLPVAGRYVELVVDGPEEPEYVYAVAE